MKVNNKIEYIAGTVSSNIICKEDITPQQVAEFIEKLLRGKKVVVELIDYLVLEYSLIKKEDAKSKFTTTEIS